ncbi:hypothetical protein PVK06_036551 [Gossypium arboreum]|uniref:Trehalose 6-phosphate phosphatase n=1 Tax=Gossypium arboreum TaxID=29729 RepID=A0ABR0NJU7_GOSAR|nr:hypothetical protein PVK06_036551 [Gossypium arboreum]
MALFLDYDRTLSPIVDNPDFAFMSIDMRAAVAKVAKYFPTAIISGRSHNKVYDFVGLTDLYYAGSHGIDIMGPVRNYLMILITALDLLISRFGASNLLIFLFPMTLQSLLNYILILFLFNAQCKGVKLFQPANEFLPMIDEVFNSHVNSTKEIKGAKVENNKFCVSVHYHNVDEKNWKTVAECVHDVIRNYLRLRLSHGRKVLKVRPVINWDKGKALTFLLESLGLSNHDDVLSIYVGDDRTDEDAFKVLREGNLGYGILVSSAPKESIAVIDTSRAAFLHCYLNNGNYGCGLSECN